MKTAAVTGAVGALGLGAAHNMAPSDKAWADNDVHEVRTSCRACIANCGVIATVSNGRVIKLRGDSIDPMSKGRMCPKGLSGIQALYHPNRNKYPMKRVGAKPGNQWERISWDEAAKTVAQHMIDMRDKTGKHGLLCTTGGGGNPQFFSPPRFRNFWGAGNVFEPGCAQCYLPRNFTMPLVNGIGDTSIADSGCSEPYKPAKYGGLTEVYVIWGTGPAWHSPSTSGRCVAELRDNGCKTVVVDPRFTADASKTDVWLPIKPGTELFLLLGVARQLIKDGVAAPAGGLDDFAALVAKWTPEKVCEITGLMPERFAAVVDGLKKAKKPLVVVGSDMDQGGGTGPVRIGMAINMLLDRVNKEGGMRMIPLAPPAVNGAASYDVLMQGDLVRYAADMAQGNMPEVGVLMVYEANPVYALPGKDIEAVFKKSDFSVAFTCFFDETARRCDLVLPNALGLERYDDVAEPFSYGKFVYALVRPVAEPLYQARPTGDVIIDMAYKLGINLGVSDVVTMLKAKAFNIGADWGSLSDGNVYVSDIVVPNKTLAYRFSPDDLALVEKAEAAAASSGKELAVAFVSKLGLGTPETAIPPFNTKLITDDELDKNMLVAAVNGATLKKLGLYEGNRIVLTSKAGKVMAKIRVFEGVTNDTVALTMGFGHTAFGEFNDGKGMDVMALVTPSSEPGSGLSVWNDTRVNVAQA